MLDYQLLTDLILEILETAQDNAAFAADARRHGATVEQWTAAAIAGMVAEEFGGAPAARPVRKRGAPRGGGRPRRKRHRRERVVSLRDCPIMLDRKLLGDQTLDILYYVQENADSVATAAAKDGMTVDQSTAGVIAGMVMEHVGEVLAGRTRP
jgi:hypothetical protein